MPAGVTDACCSCAIYWANCSGWTGSAFPPDTTRHGLGCEKCFEHCDVTYRCWWCRKYCCERCIYTIRPLMTKPTEFETWLRQTDMGSVMFEEDAKSFSFTGEQLQLKFKLRRVRDVDVVGVTLVVVSQNQTGRWQDTLSRALDSLCTITMANQIALVNVSVFFNEWCVDNGYVRVRDKAWTRNCVFVE